MKKFTFGVTAALFAAFSVPAYAADVMVASTMQRCTTNEECTLVTNSCHDNCAFVPVNRSNLSALETLYQSRCNKPMSANPTCKMNPPISAACINARCTIDYAYANNAGAKDYQAGAYPVPEAPVPSKVPGDYSNVDDRSGNFTAYNLPEGSVKQDTVGTITTKVYVPPSAPVSGGNYVPVTGAAASASAPGAPVAPAQAPAVAPATTAPAPTPPAVIPPAAVPTAETHATPPTATSPSNTTVVPAMTPSKPNQLPPEVPPVQTPPPAPVPPAPIPTAPVTTPQTYVPAPTVPSASAPGLPRAPSQAAAPAVPAVGAPGVPQAPAGSTPIPPSDLKPAPTFVPPPGTPVPVAPEDPGAPPPEGTTMLMPLPDGTMATVGGPPAKAEAKKSFSAAKKKEDTYN